MIIIIIIRDFDDLVDAALGADLGTGSSPRVAPGGPLDPDRVARNTPARGPRLVNRTANLPRPAAVVAAAPPVAAGGGGGGTRGAVATTATASSSTATTAAPPITPYGGGVYAPTAPITYPTAAAAAAAAAAASAAAGTSSVWHYISEEENALESGTSLFSARLREMPPQPWSCSACTYLAPASAQTCPMCRTAAPLKWVAFTVDFEKRGEEQKLGISLTPCPRRNGQAQAIKVR